MNTRWELLPTDEKKQLLLEKKLNISPTLAQILAKRNLNETQAHIFLHPEDQAYHDPFLLKNMQKACKRLVSALTNNERICIYGDYDVDGVTSTTLLMIVMKELGFDIHYYLPDRHNEGYGLHIESLDKLIPDYDLIITVDCGITAVKEIDYAKDKIDIIITDHHLPGENLPDAFAIINPMQIDCAYPNKNLCGVGVAFKLCQGIYKSLNKDALSLEKYLDIVALGTIADIVPLLDENRRFVKKGLSTINNLGIKTLIDLCDYDETTINTGHIGFGIAPRLNAAGRLTHASTAVELLLSTDKALAQEKALYLDNENRKRQEIVEDIFNEAILQIENQQLFKQKVIIVVGDNWHEGVIGITASRLQEKYYRPIIIIATKGNIGKASCRSIDGFHMKDALTHCEQYLVVYGGHSKAAGFTIELTQLEPFIHHLQNYAEQKLTDNDLIPIHHVEAVLSPQDISLEFVEELSLLEPFGMGNPKPSFVCQQLMVDKATSIGKEQNHLRFNFHDSSNKQYTAIGWHMAEYAENIKNHYVDILFQPELNHWNDRIYLQFKLSDLKLTSNEHNYLESYPSYALISKVYLSIKQLSRNTENIAFSQIAIELKRLYNIHISPYCLKQCLQILSEIDILKINDTTVKLLPLNNRKFDINNSPTFSQRFNLQML